MLDDFKIFRWLTSTFACIYMAPRYYYFAEKPYMGGGGFQKNMNSRKCISAYKYSLKYKYLSNMRNQKQVYCIYCLMAKHYSSRAKLCLISVRTW